ncbi:5189_t:CDS:2 [Ambispora gerdemannii]|uniref:5189_t:CDS:1 n=1 Tax=Ambispora gerdemannii TaxID=144530 RepID=A0A9N9A1J2_9GLOM|nr:5189_t:CDS:2 [Ambispora gerdemannii]
MTNTERDISQKISANEYETVAFMKSRLNYLQIMMKKWVNGTSNNIEILNRYMHAKRKSDNFMMQLVANKVKLAPLVPASTIASSPNYNSSSFSSLHDSTTAAIPPPISNNNHSTSQFTSGRWARRFQSQQQNLGEQDLTFSRMVNSGNSVSLGENMSEGADGGNNDNVGVNEIGNNMNTITTAITTSTTTAQSTDNSIPSMHHHFRSKPVCKLYCAHCNTRVCVRGMKAMLLADTRIELFSTDVPPISVQLVADDYITQNCHCKIRDVACLMCGNTLGYHITQPCQQCMESCNNGHFWMFHIEAVTSEERMDALGRRILLWANLPRAEQDFEVVDSDDDEYDRIEYDEICFR